MSSKVWLVFYFEDLFILSKERLVSWILEVVSLKCVLFFKKKTKIIYREGFLEIVFFFFFFLHPKLVFGIVGLSMDKNNTFVCE